MLELGCLYFDKLFDAGRPNLRSNRSQISEELWICLPDVPRIVDDQPGAAAQSDRGHRHDHTMVKMTVDDFIAVDPGRCPMYDELVTPLLGSDTDLDQLSAKVGDTIAFLVPKVLDIEEPARALGKRRERGERQHGIWRLGAVKILSSKGTAAPHSQPRWNLLDRNAYFAKMVNDSAVPKFFFLEPLEHNIRLHDPCHRQKCGGTRGI